MNNNRIMIIQTAYRLFMEKGYQQTTTKEIAIAAEINESTIFRMFKSKENLFHSSIAYFTEQAILTTFDPLLYSGDLRVDIMYLITAMVDIHIQLTPSYRLLIKVSQVKDAVLKDIKQKLNNQQNVFKQFVIGLQLRQLVKPIDSEMFIETLFSLIFMESFDLLIDADKQGFESRRKTYIEKYTNYCLNILQPKGDVIS